VALILHATPTQRLLNNQNTCPKQIIKFQIKISNPLPATLESSRQSLSSFTRVPPPAPLLFTFHPGLLNSFEFSNASLQISTSSIANMSLSKRDIELIQLGFKCFESPPKVNSPEAHLESPISSKHSSYHITATSLNPHPNPSPKVSTLTNTFRSGKLRKTSQYRRPQERQFRPDMLQRCQA